MKKGTVIYKDNVICTAGIADSYFLRLRGLVGRDVNELGSLWIKPCSQIHCCFMGYPIDVVYLDRDMNIVAIDRGVEPWRFRPVVRTARSVLEFAAGRADEYCLEIGQKMNVMR